jgi:hypothetical protein
MHNISIKEKEKMMIKIELKLWLYKFRIKNDWSKKQTDIIIVIRW